MNLFIMNQVRLRHTRTCIKYKFENLINKIPFTVFRDFNANSDPNIILSDIDNEFNFNALNEDKELRQLNKSLFYNIYWLLNASHTVWSNEIYKKQIINYVKTISIDGCVM